MSAQTVDRHPSICKPEKVYRWIVIDGQRRRVPCEDHPSLRDLEQNELRVIGWPRALTTKIQ